MLAREVVAMREYCKNVGFKNVKSPIVLERPPLPVSTASQSVTVQSFKVPQESFASRESHSPLRYEEHSRNSSVQQKMTQLSQIFGQMRRNLVN